MKNERSERPAPLAAGVPLGTIIPRQFDGEPSLAVLNMPRSAAAERYRRVAAHLEREQGGDRKEGDLLLVTSAVPGEGKTTTAINLALAWAEHKDRRVLLVDGDLRRPAIGRRLNPAPKLGLAEVLRGGISLDHGLVTPKNTRLTVLPAGEAVHNPLELFRSDDLPTVFAEFRRRFDVVIIDTPPCIPFADATVLLADADGVLLVVRAGSTAKPIVDKAMQTLEDGALRGVVLNDVHVTPVDRYYYRYDSYDPYAYTREDGKK